MRIATLGIMDNYNRPNRNNYYKAIRNFLIYLAIIISASGCQAPPEGREDQLFDGQRALELAAQQVEIGPRYPGSPGHAQIQVWLAQELAEWGWQVDRQEFSYQGVELVNVIGRSDFDGDPMYLLGAHYDTRPVADQEREVAPGPVIGANDGASGVAVLLELARVLPPDEMQCQLRLAFFDGEDSGDLAGWDWIVGSSYLAENLDQAPTGVVIVDMVGDRDLNLPKERNSSDELQQEIWSTAQELGYSAFEDRQGYSMLDDHTPFLRAGIPAVDIIDFDYPYWHTEQDTLDKISAQSLDAVGRTLQQWLQARCLPADPS